MPSTLYVVATPIGNLEDVTFRALRVLREVDLIAAEDTRRTAKLLQHYSISTRATSFHEHNEHQKQARLLACLRDGRDLALVADAGTPTISDPGSRLVAAALGEGIKVQVVPGPSAVLAALVGSGLSTDSFTFVGFPPNRSNARSRWLRALTSEPRTLVFFEAPHRIRATLEQALEIWGDREVAIGRELTKKHEELVKGPISLILGRISALKGEMTVVVGPAEAAVSTEELPGPHELWKEFCCLTENRQTSRRETIALLAKRHRVSARLVYAEVEKGKNSGK